MTEATLQSIIGAAEAELTEARSYLRRAIPIASVLNERQKLVDQAEAAVWACRRLERFPRWEW